MTFGRKDLTHGFLCALCSSRPQRNSNFVIDQPLLKHPPLVFEVLIIKLKICKRKISEAWLYFGDDRAFTVMFKYM